MRGRALTAAFATAVIAAGTAAVIVAPPGATAATPSAVRQHTAVTSRRAPHAAKAALAQNAATATPSPTPTPAPTPLTVGVVIFPAAKSDVKTASGDKSYYEGLAAKLNSLGAFHAWVVDSDCKPAPCRLSDARIYVYGQEAAAGADKPATLTLTSFFASAAQVQRIDSVALTISTTNDGTKTVADVSPQQIRTLVGQLVLDDQFQIAINLPGTEAALQLVPSPVNETDPDYEPILEHILATFGVPAVRSRLSASAIRGPSDASTCPGAQRYFIYRVRLEEYPHKLLGRTRLESYAEGFILDCTAPTTVAAATGKGAHDFPTTSTLLTNLSALAIALYPKAQSRQLTLGANAFSKLVDVDPRSADVRDAVASRSLAQLVNNLCVRLLQEQPSASPSPSPLPAGQTPSPAPKASPWIMSRASVEPLRCRDRIPYRPQARGPAPETERFETIKKQWNGETPSPSPSPRS